jgi:hypothetical protein
VAKKKFTGIPSQETVPAMIRYRNVTACDEEMYTTAEPISSKINYKFSGKLEIAQRDKRYGEFMHWGETTGTGTTSEASPSWDKSQKRK